MESALPEFFLKREKMIGELERTARKVNDWWTERHYSEPTLHDLALLEGMLAERKSLLERMMQLDDDMLGKLVETRAHNVSDGA